jgi:hypothetical protein
MSKPLAVPPDAERIVIDYLTASLLARGKDVTVGVIIPTAWTSATKPHVQVALDGTPIVEYPVFGRASMRITAWASTTTAAKALAGLCEGLMLSHPGSNVVSSVQPLTGVLPTRDPDTGAQLASISVRVNLRYVILT